MERRAIVTAVALAGIVLGGNATAQPETWETWEPWQGEGFGAAVRLDLATDGVEAVQPAPRTEGGGLSDWAYRTSMHPFVAKLETYDGPPRGSSEGGPATLREWVEEARETERKRTAGAQGRKLNVFGEDDRVPMKESLMQQFPARAIARLESISGWCTATIVSKYLIVTNSHCVQTDSAGITSVWWRTASVRVALNDVDHSFRVFFHRVMYSPKHRGDLDFAVIQLEHPIGEFTGWPGIRWVDLDYFKEDRSVSLLAYSRDFWVKAGTAGGHFSCSTRGVHKGFEVAHDCDMSGGASGGAILMGLALNAAEDAILIEEGPYVVGLNTAEYRPSDSTSPLFLPEYHAANRNVMLPSADFRNAFEELLAADEPPNAVMCAPKCSNSLRGNGVCDTACMNGACNFDDGDCRCAPGCGLNLLGNGVCNAACNVPGCEFDKGDCECSPGCLQHWEGDKFCDRVCNTPECKYDAGDCDCAPGCHVGLLFNDVCDKVCNNKACDFDRGSCTCAPGCSANLLGNGVCDDACSAASCSYDAGDCCGRIRKSRACNRARGCKFLNLKGHGKRCYGEPFLATFDCASWKSRRDCRRRGSGVCAWRSRACINKFDTADS